MQIYSLILGLLGGTLVGLLLGIGVVAFDRKRLLRTLLARSSPSELAEIQAQIVAAEARMHPVDQQYERISTPPDAR